MHAFYFFLVLEVLAFSIFLVSELMKLIVKERIKKSTRMNNRFRLYHRIALCLFIFSFGLYILNDTLLKKKIPIELIGYLVFLSLGLYVGFHVCLDEVKRMSNKK